jgi:hypothetical protein
MDLYRPQDVAADAPLSTITDALSSPQAALALVAGLNSKRQRCVNSTMMQCGYTDKLPRDKPLTRHSEMFVFFSIIFDL